MNTETYIFMKKAQNGNYAVIALGNPVKVHRMQMVW